MGLFDKHKEKIKERMLSSAVRTVGTEVVNLFTRKYNWLPHINTDNPNEYSLQVMLSPDSTYNAALHLTEDVQLQITVKEQLASKASAVPAACEVVVVRTKDDLNKVKQDKPQRIEFEGDMAKKIAKAMKAKKAGKITAIIGGIVAAVTTFAAICAIPVTGGASMATEAGIYGLVAEVGTTTVVMDTADILITAGVIAAILGCTVAIVKDVIKNYDMVVEKTSNGEVRISGTRKQK